MIYNYYIFIKYIFSDVAVTSTLKLSCRKQTARRSVYHLKLMLRIHTRSIAIANRSRSVSYKSFWLNTTISGCMWKTIQDRAIVTTER